LLIARSIGFVYLRWIGNGGFGNNVSHCTSFRFGAGRAAMTSA
jgi:hypothetical protein